MSRKIGKKNTGTYWLYGVHSVQAAIDNPRRSIRRLCLTAAAADKIRTGNLRAEMVSAEQIEKYVSRDATHQGVAAEVDCLEPLELDEVLPLKQVIVLLDQVTDPHNIGAVLRSAAAFGAAAVVVPRDHAAGESAVLAKAASGAMELVPLVAVTNIAHAIGEMKEAGYWVLGLDGAGEKSVAALKEYTPLCIALGAEGKGLRRLTAERCDVLVKIPIHAQMESLNVSNAAAIALYAAGDKA